MKTVEPKTLKGFRDFLPQQARKRQYVVDTLKKVFESYGFEPLETPALEYEEILLGKYGEEGDKLMYRFTDNGDRKVAMRYDQTVPLARVVAQYQNELAMPFKRYQIQNVWRAENTQKGRFREFLQCDCDIVGTTSALSDAEVIATSAKALEKLGFTNYKILLNDRVVFSLLMQRESVLQEKELMPIVRAIDKIKKIGREKVLEEIIAIGIPTERATYILQAIETQESTQRLSEVMEYLTELGVEKNKFEFLPTLARGLDYYTGLIFEIEIDGYSAGSVCGGGRYDELIGMFTGKQIPAVGFAFGFDRLMEAMDELGLFPNELSVTKVLVTIFSPELKEKSLETASFLRSKNINTEFYPDVNAKMEKQLKYADQKGIPYVVIIGPDEAKNNTLTLKDLKKRTQETLSLDEAIKKLQ